MEEITVKGVFPCMDKPFLGKPFEGIVKLRKLTFREKKQVEKVSRTIKLVEKEAVEKDFDGNPVVDVHGRPKTVKKMEKEIEIHDDRTDLVALNYAIADAPWWKRNENGIVIEGNSIEWVENLPEDVGELLAKKVNDMNTRKSDVEGNSDGQSSGN